MDLLFEDSRLDSLDLTFLNYSYTRKKIKGKRFYNIIKDDNTKVLAPSVTSVLGSINKEGLQKWRERIGEKRADNIARNAADRGIIMHKLIEIYLNTSIQLNTDNRLEQTFSKLNRDEEIKDLKPRDYVVGTILFYKLLENNILDYVEKAVLQEVPLYYKAKKILFAGTVDFVGIVEKKLKVVDFKTALKYKQYIDKYEKQISAYTIAFEFLTGVKIDGAEIWISNEKTQEKPQRLQYNRQQLDNLFKDFVNDYNLFLETLK